MFSHCMTMGILVYTGRKKCACSIIIVFLQRLRNTSAAVLHQSLTLHAIDLSFFPQK